jgi:hypothetical protein
MRKEMQMVAEGISLVHRSAGFLQQVAAEDVQPRKSNQPYINLNIVS